ncbi:MAG TPA: response regulator [Cytophagales bacterium]|nr:response regulator [Cytophagales bacterium]
MKKVLLVDDDPVANFLHEDLIKRCLMSEVEVANNGMEALDKINAGLEIKSFPDLILLDINMPIMDGFEFLEAFDKIPEKPPVKIVILSSSISPRDISSAQKYNIEGYINKPLSFSKLQEALYKPQYKAEG